MPWGFLKSTTKVNLISSNHSIIIAREFPTSLQYAVRGPSGPLIFLELNMRTHQQATLFPLAYWVYFIGSLLLFAACAAPPPQPPARTGAPAVQPSPTPAGAVANDSAAVDDFLIARLGQAYFAAHFTPLQAQPTGAFIKASYLYSYAPFIDRFPMTIFYDPAEKAISPGETSLILLSPQEFVLNRQAAIAAAAPHGLHPAGPHEVELILGPETQGRFAWKITAPAAPAIGAPPGSLAIITLDVQTGQVYQIEVAGMSTSH